MLERSRVVHWLTNAPQYISSPPLAPHLFILVAVANGILSATPHRTAPHSTATCPTTTSSLQTPDEHDAAQERLNEVYERMRQISASTAEARASKILHGLGFTEVMQKRATQLFRWAGGEQVGGWRCDEGRSWG